MNDDVKGMVYITVSGAEVEVLEWAGDHARVLYLRTGEERTLPVESLQPGAAAMAELARRSAS